MLPVRSSSLNYASISSLNGTKDGCANVRPFFETTTIPIAPGSPIFSQNAARMNSQRSRFGVLLMAISESIRGL